MSLELIIGPMFAGKSTELLRRIRRYKLFNKNIIVVGISMDSRSGKFLCTHDQQKYSICIVDNLGQLFHDEHYLHSDIIVFDEAQFFPDLVECVKLFLKDKKHVLCAGLSSTYKQTPFENISQLISLASDITFLKAICTHTYYTHTTHESTICGKDAPFTSKLVTCPDTCIDDDIAVGGSDVYAPRCSEHFT